MLDRAFQIKRLRSAYFCCSAGLSAGFGGLVWFCCGLAGVLGFWSPEAEPGVLVIVITFHEYLKNIFQVHLKAGAGISEYKTLRQFILFNRSPRSGLLCHGFAAYVTATVQSAGDPEMTDGDKIAAAVMATGLCSKVSASPDEYVKNYYLILEKMQQDEARRSRDDGAPRRDQRAEPGCRRRASRTTERRVSHHATRLRREAI